MFADYFLSCIFGEFDKNKSYVSLKYSFVIKTNGIKMQ